MIEEKLYKVELSGRCFHVIANNFAEAEQFAMKVIEEYKIQNNPIYRIELNGKVYRPKTKTITIDV